MATTPTPKLKIAILTTLSIIFCSVVLFFIYINIYDYSFYHYIKKLFVSEEVTSPKEKHYILNIEQPISSELFKNTLYFIADSNPAYIVIDNDFSNLSDTNAVSQIMEFIGSSDSIYSAVKVQDKKGLSLPFARYYSDEEEMTKHLVYLKTSADFFLSNYLDDIRFNRTLQFPANRIGFIGKPKSMLQRGTFDLFYKIGNKYGINLPYLIYLKQNGIDIEKQQIGYFKTALAGKLNKNLYFDQKGRGALSAAIEIKDSLVANKFNDWNSNIPLRSEIIENLTYLEKYTPGHQGFERYTDEKKIIEEAYNLESLADEDKNTLLETAKQRVQVWKSFAQAKAPFLEKSAVFIVSEGNYEWVREYLAEKSSIENSLNLVSFPILLTYAVIAVFFIIILLLTAFKSRGTGILFSILFILAAIAAGFSARFFLHIQLPLFSFICALILAVFAGSLLKLLTTKLWEHEVYAIYKQNISPKFNTLIAASWKYSPDLFDMKSKLSTFISIDISSFMKNDYERNEVESISIKTSDIENKIKQNFGIINSTSPSHISAYFGNPAIRSNPVIDSIKTGQEIMTEHGEKDESTSAPLVIAMHSKYEWFKFIKSKKEKYYTNFGTSPIILDAMIRVAKSFEIGIIISDNLYKLAQGTLKVRMLNRINIPSIEVSIRTFELLNTQQIQQLGNLPDYFHAGLKLFESKQFEDASFYFKQCLKIFPDDIPSEIYLQRCKDFMYIPPKKEWDGAYIVE